VILGLKKTGFSGDIKPPLWRISPQNLLTNVPRQRHFKNGHRLFRKFLWLIPFTLAKKLLSLNLSVAKDIFG